MATAEEGNQNKEAAPAATEWGRWGFSVSVLSDLQKAASAAAEEISRNAVAVAKSSAKGIAADTQNDAASGPGPGRGPTQGEDAKPQTSLTKGDDEDNTAEDEDDRLSKSALDRLEKASEDSLFGQGLKVLDDSVESFASGAWQALGSAWKGGSTLVHKLEHSAANLADSIQQGSLPVKASSFAPSIIESGKSFTAKGMEVLERVGKETVEMLIAETGLIVEKSSKEVDQQAEFEEVTFDRCFYIYGGPDQLEELEALSSHYTLLFNRRKAKLLSEQKSFYDGKLKQIQQIFSLDTDIEEIGVESDKGKKIDAVDDSSGIEMKSLRDSCVSKAADMAAGFTAALGGLSANEIVQRTTDRLDTVHSEGVHRISELCCFVVSQLLMLGKSVISNASISKTEETEKDNVKTDWPENSASKAKIIRSKAQLMSGDVEAVSNSFLTGVLDVIEAYVAAIQSATSEKQGLTQQNSIQEKADTITNHLRVGRTTALGKIQDALHCLAYVVVSTSMPTA